MEARPHPSRVRRVAAKKRPNAWGNSAKKLQWREIAAYSGRAFATSTAAERFRNIQLQGEFDTHDPKENGLLQPYLRKRSEIIEIVGASDIIFALSQLGICAAFSRATNQRICFMNGSSDEVIHSLFYNKNNDSLITVSVFGSEDFSDLRCRTTPIEYIRRGKPDAGFPLFETESLRPGFVEFDDENGKVLTHSAHDSSGIMLLIYTANRGYLPLDILSIEDGKLLKSFRHLLHHNKRVDFIEQFNEKLLVKQHGENFQILDVSNSKIIEVSRSAFVTPSAFIFLNEMQLVLTFRNREVLVWNCRGELVTSFEDHLLWHPDCNLNSIYVTTNQDLIISCCKDDPDDSYPEDNACSINVKIKARNLSKQTKSLKFLNTPAEALRDITSLYYDEEHEEIYTLATNMALCMCGQINSCSGKQVTSGTNRYCHQHLAPLLCKQLSSLPSWWECGSRSCKDFYPYS
ncbi:hypothetical protein BRADI_2g53347v3 [Brachypodium distachyon]|uniref:Uncharacterized protein n=1 Tax=Brachypodium distachyon TaxID=15368 RepID=I1HST8_BRADI|nr:hypothetical protein BRADI_2g53347v3 [Brachypodium distachyon]